MIRRYGAAFRLTLAAADCVLALLVLYLATWVRFGDSSDWPTDVSADVPNPNVAAVSFVAMWIVVLWLHGLYRSRERWTRRGDLYTVLRATLVQLALTLSALYLFKLADVSRLLLIFIFPSLAASAIGMRILVRQVLVLARDKGRNVRYMLVVGTNARAEAFAGLVERHAELGLVVVGHLRAAHKDAGRTSRPVLGTIEDLESVLHSQIIDEVAICLPFSMEELIGDVALLCEQEGKTVRLPVAPVERILTSARLESLDGVGVYSLANAPDRAISLMVKRLLDILASALLLVLLAPLMAVIALVIKLDSRGPALFRQERVGLHGRIFRVVKFRSMCADAEDRLPGIAHRNMISGHAFKVTGDPRITRVGRFLRRSSVDELPQLWNVLRGEMSLVGPRPPLPVEVAKYDVWHRRRLSMKPGMTGLWQVGDRRDPEFDRWVEQDLRYIDTWSLWLDVKIMARTVPAMLSGTGR